MKRNALSNQGTNSFGNGTPFSSSTTVLTLVLDDRVSKSRI
jgi:hypothetical protein